jgi:hypothetical protein
MDHPTHARSPGAELRIALNPEKNKARWVGTLQQLIQEGVIPADKEPSCDESGARWVAEDMHYAVRRVTDSAIPAVFEVTTFYFGGNLRKRAIHRKLAELSELMDAGSTASIERLRAFDQARRDQSFQDIKRRLIGQKRRGRKPANANKGAA